MSPSLTRIPAGRRARSGSLPARRQLPEAIREAEPVEDRLRVVEAAGQPVGVEPRVPPRVRELARLRRADRRDGLVAVLLEPAGGVLIRPEEVHRASGEDDVVPPVLGGYEDVDGVVVGDRPLPDDVELDRLAAVGAARRDVPLDAERGADAEGVPRAVRVPPAPGRLNPVRGRDGRERVRHPDPRRGALEYQRVRVVQPPERRLDLAEPELELVRDFVRPRCAPELDEAAIDVAADAEVELVHQWRKCRRAVITIAAPACSTAASTSSSLTEPPGWMIAVTPSSSARFGPSGNGKNASEASTAPCRSWPSSRAFPTAIRTASTRDIWPAPIPIVCRSFASTIAFELTCLQTRQAKSRSPQAASSSRPQRTSISSRSSMSQSRSCTSRPPRTRL